MNIKSQFIIGIDATNLSHGGGKAHLIEFLNSANPTKNQFSKIIIWATNKILEEIEDKEWLIKICPFKKNIKLIQRLYWQIFDLSKAAINKDCDILFVPGGIFLGKFYPVVTMSQNLLPFNQFECSRYGISFKRLKLLLLQYLQSRTFKNVEGVIFLTSHAKEIVQKKLGTMKNNTIIIPHGLNKRFISDYRERPENKSNIKILYVSHIEHYKNHSNVIKALANLRMEKYSITLDLFGSKGTAMKKLNKAIQMNDKYGEWINFRKEVPYEKIHLIYRNYDYGIFASTCENLPITLLEMMGSGIRIACSNFDPMPEILGNKGLYFNPLDVNSITNAVRNLIIQGNQFDKPSTRLNLRNLSNNYNWEKTTKSTFAFLKKVKNTSKK